MRGQSNQRGSDVNVPNVLEVVHNLQTNANPQQGMRAAEPRNTRPTPTKNQENRNDDDDAASAMPPFEGPELRQTSTFGFGFTTPHYFNRKTAYAQIPGYDGGLNSF